MINRLKTLLKTSLSSYGVVGFISHPVPAGMVLIATFYHPIVGLLGLTGSIISNMISWWLGANSKAWRTGVFGVSGLLVGVAVGMYAPFSMKMVVFVLIGSAAVGVISTFLGLSLSRYDLPMLSVPLMLMIWPLLLSLGIDKIDTHTYPAVHLFRAVDIWLFQSLPLELFEFLKMFGNIVFQENLVSGLLILLAIGITSRISLLYALWGGILGMATYFYLHGSLDGFHGLNFVLTALAFGGYFIVANRHAFFFCSLAVVTVGLVDFATFQFLNPPSSITVATLPSAVFKPVADQIPTLVFAFNVVTLAFLYPLKLSQHEQVRPRLLPVPLALIKSPEVNLRWAKRWLNRRYLQKTMLTLPFLGEWSVLQGNDGEWTHKGKGCYAWDFVVRDPDGKQHRSDGKKVEDYYCFGLPVFAPAPGTVVAVENTVEDNEPGTAVTERNWGNYVIIDHLNGEYCEISHFKQNSIPVVPGQRVERGQLLGYCGNSGRSPVPHIHFQLQKGFEPGSETLPAVFAEAVRDGQIEINLNPSKDDTLTPVQIPGEKSWSLLGRETEVWRFQCRKGLRRFTETIYFTTDEVGAPILSTENNNVWYIYEKPHFIQLVPDFRTFSGFLSLPYGRNSLVKE